MATTTARPLPHEIPVAVTASKTLTPGWLELMIVSTRETQPAVLADPAALIVSVNDGDGWREPARQLPPGWSLDTYRIKARKPRTLVRGAGETPDGRRCYYVRLAPPETADEYRQRKAAFAAEDAARRERNERRERNARYERHPRY